MYVIHESFTGMRHISKGIGNQDTLIVKPVSGKTYALIACDGVSSCEKAAEASKYVAKSIYENLFHLMTKEGYSPCLKVLEAAANMTLLSLVEKAKGEGVDVYEYGTTAEVILYDAEKMNSYIFHAGDGAAIIVLSDGRIRVSDTKNHSGEFANAVYPFSEKSRWEFYEEYNCCGACVVTDGVYSSMITPTQIRSYGYSYEPLMLIPLIDRRIYKTKGEMRRKIRSVMKEGYSRDDIFVYGKTIKESGLADGVDPGRAYSIPVFQSEDDMTFGAVVKKCPQKYKFEDTPDYQLIKELDYRKCYPSLV